MVSKYESIEERKQFHEFASETDSYLEYVFLVLFNVVIFRRGTLRYNFYMASFIDSCSRLIYISACTIYIY